MERPIDHDRLAAMRSEYEEGGLDEAQAGDDPFDLLTRWLRDAVDVDGRPSVRIVLMKGLDERGVTFFTHYTSRKGSELEANPRAAATLLWHPVQRLPAAESDAYFASRPHGAQVGAVGSHQSRPVTDRRALEAQVRAAEDAAGDGEVPRPSTWGGYLLVPETIEFWHGRRNRVHDRLLYRRDVGGWERVRLQP